MSLPSSRVILLALSIGVLASVTLHRPESLSAAHAGMAQGPGQGPGEGPGQDAGGRGLPPAPPPTAQSGATVDLTGYWVSLITEDWHWRMSVPEAGDVASIPFTNDEEKRAILDAWDPAVDEAEGNLCKAYGAAAIMRVPTRVHISWENDEVLKLETDAGTQTRLFRFSGAEEAASSERSLQGSSAAEWWQPPGGRGRGRGGRGRGGGAGPAGPPVAGPLAGGPGGNGALPAPPGGGPQGGIGGRGPAPAAPTTGGSMQVVTTNLIPGYLRKNGVPYSEETKVTEYYHRTPETYGDTYLIVTTIVEDPEYLTGPFITSSHFRKLPEIDNGWNPTPCSVF
jgi:hypothetical protein